MKVLVHSLMVSAVLLVGAGCSDHREGPLERAGQRADEIGRNISEGKAPLHRAGPVERAGRAMDDAVGDNERDR